MIFCFSCRYHSWASVPWWYRYRAWRYIYSARGGRLASLEHNLCVCVWARENMFRIRCQCRWPFSELSYMIYAIGIIYRNPMALLGYDRIRTVVSWVVLQCGKPIDRAMKINVFADASLFWWLRYIWCAIMSFFTSFVSLKGRTFQLNDKSKRYSPICSANWYHTPHIIIINNECSIFDDVSSSRYYRALCRPLLPRVYWPLRR